MWWKSTSRKQLKMICQRVYVNIFVACFTTWWARLHLYEALGLSQERCLYFDTDSVMFVSEPGQPNPQFGQFLGE